MVELRDLPTEVIHMTFSYCDTPALLLLRLVSQQMKAFVDSSSKFKKALEDVQIRLHASTLPEFIESTTTGVPFSNFLIDFSGTRKNDRYGYIEVDTDTPDFYTDTPHLRKFKESFCPIIRKLEVSRMFCCTFDGEFEFFERLGNLRELNIGILSSFNGKTLMTSEGVKIKVKRPGQPFNNEPNRVMKRLEVCDARNKSQEFLTGFIKSCPSLEMIKIPVSSSDEPLGKRNSAQARLARERNNYYPNILRLGAQGHLRQLKRLDLESQFINMDFCTPDDIRFFQEMVSSKKVRLENVPRTFLRLVTKMRNPLSIQTVLNFTNSVDSFHGIAKLLKGIGFVNLQELSFNSHEDLDWTADFREICLPALRKIKAVILPVRVEANVEKIQNFIDRIFTPAVPRLTVTELDLEVGFNAESHFGLPRRSEPEYAVNFQLVFLDAGFPNLTRLTFRNNSFTRTELCDFIEIISRKIHLEELSLFISRGIPEEAFFGTNPNETPVFLRLQNLKKLELDASYISGVKWSEDVTEKMGNRMLTMLSKTKLTRLSICGGGVGWTKVTSDAIRSLTEGPFGKSILWVRLEVLEGSILEKLNSRPGKNYKALKELARVAHRNRVSKRITSISFDQFWMSQKALRENKRRFRISDNPWLEKQTHLY